MAGELGFGAQFGYADTLGGSYTNFANVMDVMSPQLTVARIDKSYHGMTDPYREKFAGLADAGEADFVLFFLKTALTTIYGFHRTDKFYRVRFPTLSGETTPSMWRCAGFIADLSTPIPLDEKMLMNVKVVFSGKPTFTEGS